MFQNQLVVEQGRKQMKVWSILGGSIGDWVRDVLCLQRMPNDPGERRKIKVFILGSVAGSAVRCESDGKIHIEVEEVKADGVRR